MEELPPGFRFYPTEEELISFYLRNKLEGNTPELDRVIPVVDIYVHEPWELPRLAGERCIREREQWFFFMPRQEREARGGKPNRTTATGYWKATGSPGYVFSSSTTQTRGIGVKKTMVFYKGRAPSGKKTQWKMNEYKAIDVVPDHELLASSSSAPPLAIPKLRNEMSVCRVYITSGSSRAFDRRPSATLPLGLHQPPHSDHQLITINAATTATTTATAAGDQHTNMNAAAAAVGALVVPPQEKSGSTDSSGGDDDDQIREQDHEDAAAGSSTTNMNNDDEEMLIITTGLHLPLSWEWEPLIWP